jgi:hypothetical protein
LVPAGNRQAEAASIEGSFTAISRGMTPDRLRVKPAMTALMSLGIAIGGRKLAATGKSVIKEPKHNGSCHCGLDPQSA